jgi:hypothetical protein
MVAVVLAVLGVLALGVAAVLKGADNRRGSRLALASSIALVMLGAGLAIAGAIRWRDCFRGSGGNYFRVTGTFNEHSGFTPTERCPQRLLGVRDPF